MTHDDIELDSNQQYRYLQKPSFLFPVTNTSTVKCIPTLSCDQGGGRMHVWSCRGSPLEEEAEALWEKGLDAYVIRQACIPGCYFAISGT